MEIVSYTQSIWVYLTSLAYIDMGLEHKDLRVKHESHGVVIDDCVSTIEATLPHMSIGRNVVDMYRVALKQPRDVVLSGSSYD